MPQLKTQLSLLGLVFSMVQSALANSEAVATVYALTGRAVIENQAGQRRLANLNMPLYQGEYVLVLEKSKLSLQYVAKHCNAHYQANTLFTIQAAAGCQTPTKVLRTTATLATASAAIGSGTMFKTGAAVLGIVALKDIVDLPISVYVEAVPIPSITP